MDITSSGLTANGDIQRYSCFCRVRGSGDGSLFKFYYSFKTTPFFISHGNLNANQIKKFQTTTSFYLYYNVTS